VWLLWILLGLVIGVVGVTPILQVLLRRAEHRARLAERRARNAERLAEIGSMTAGLAHEIKNPLSTIGLNAQLLAEGLNDAELPAQERDRLLNRLGALSREAERLRAILTDFLQFAGRVKLDARPRDLVRIVAELRDFFHPQCDQSRVVLRTKLPETPVRVPVDESLFKQALLNLMINATQAMTNGATTAEGSHETRGELILQIDADSDEARIHVIDTGPGIEPDRLEQIFHPYVSHSIGGSGLGLSTARRIIEEHGGRIVAHSDVGRGSDFVIHLPMKGRAGRIESPESGDTP
jgi:signal transduction histidine kinase